MTTCSFKSAKSKRKSLLSMNYLDRLEDIQLVSLDNLREWIRIFGSSSSSLKPPERVFIDEYGNTRDSKWRKIDSDNSTASPLQPRTDDIEFKRMDKHDEESPRPNGSSLLRTRARNHELQETTGVILRRVIILKDENKNGTAAEDVKEGESEYQTVECYFLSDWQRLWNFLHEDDLDEIEQTIPYLRICVELFFHRRTCQMMYVLFVWNFLVYALTQNYYQHAIPTLLANSYYVSLIFMLAVYICACIMFRGRFPRFFERNRDPFLKDSFGNALNLQTHATNIALDEVQQIRTGKEHHVHWTSAVRQMFRKSYEEIRMLSHDMRKQRLKSANHLEKGMFYYKWLNMALKFLRRHNGVDPKKIAFNRPAYRAMMLFSIFVFPFYIFIANYVATYLIYVEPTCRNDIHNKGCEYFIAQVILTGGTLTLFLMQYIYGASILICLVGLAYGGEVAFRLADCWLRKYGCLRRVRKLDACRLDHSEDRWDEPAPERFSTVADEVPTTPSSDNDDAREEKQKKQNATGSEEIANLIRRDAIEHYLFIRCMMENAGEIWSPVLTGLLVLALYLSVDSTVYLAYYNIALVTVIRLAIYITVRIVFLIIYPVVSIAFANSYIIKLSEAFKFCAEEDFPVLGGRNHWLEIFEKFPATWTYHGVNISTERLIGLSWTTFLAFASVLASVLFGGNIAVRR